MKRASIAFLSILLAPPVFADAGQHLIPAGSLISCTTAEPKLSSKTTAVGDPVLCKVGFTERYGRSTLPYNSYLEGRFEDYKDPGHFVGKGWMELKFDRMVIEPDTVIPIDARVVDVPGYKVDAQGRILGKGHAVRDAVMWSIPVLWPVDLLMLPMRGPRPTLKEETRLTLKVMDDLPVPDTTGPAPDPYGLYHRSPYSENAMPPAPGQDQPGPDYSAYDPSQDQPAPNYAAPQPPYGYAQPAPYAYVPAPPVVVAPPPVYAYAPWVIAPRAVYRYGYGYGYGYGGRGMVGRPYAYGRGYGYGGGARPRPQGFGGRGAMIAQARPGYGGMGFRGSFRGR